MCLLSALLVFILTRTPVTPAPHFRQDEPLPVPTAVPPPQPPQTSELAQQSNNQFLSRFLQSYRDLVNYLRKRFPEDNLDLIRCDIPPIPSNNSIFTHNYLRGKVYPNKTQIYSNRSDDLGNHKKYVEINFFERDKRIMKVKVSKHNVSNIENETESDKWDTTLTTVSFQSVENKNEFYIPKISESSQIPDHPNTVTFKETSLNSSASTITLEISTESSSNYRTSVPPNIVEQSYGTTFSLLDSGSEKSKVVRLLDRITTTIQTTNIPLSSLKPKNENVGEEQSELVKIVTTNNLENNNLEPSTISIKTDMFVTDNQSITEYQISGDSPYTTKAFNIDFSDSQNQEYDNIFSSATTDAGYLFSKDNLPPETLNETASTEDLPLETTSSAAEEKPTAIYPTQNISTTFEDFITEYSLNNRKPNSRALVENNYVSRKNETAQRVITTDTAAFGYPGTITTAFSGSDHNIEEAPIVTESIIDNQFTTNGSLFSNEVDPTEIGDINLDSSNDSSTTVQYDESYIKPTKGSYADGPNKMNASKTKKDESFSTETVALLTTSLDQNQVTNKNHYSLSTPSEITNYSLDDEFTTQNTFMDFSQTTEAIMKNNTGASTQHNVPLSSPMNPENTDFNELTETNQYTHGFDGNLAIFEDITTETKLVQQSMTENHTINKEVYTKGNSNNEKTEISGDKVVPTDSYTAGTSSLDSEEAINNSLHRNSTEKENINSFMSPKPPFFSYEKPHVTGIEVAHQVTEKVIKPKISTTAEFLTPDQSTTVFPDIVITTTDELHQTPLFTSESITNSLSTNHVNVLSSRILPDYVDITTEQISDIRSTARTNSYEADNFIMIDKITRMPEHHSSSQTWQIQVHSGNVSDQDDDAATGEIDNDNDASLSVTVISGLPVDREKNVLPTEESPTPSTENITEDSSVPLVYVNSREINLLNKNRKDPRGFLDYLWPTQGFSYPATNKAVKISFGTIHTQVTDSTSIPLEISKKTTPKGTTPTQLVTSYQVPDDRLTVNFNPSDKATPGDLTNISTENTYKATTPSVGLSPAMENKRPKWSTSIMVEKQPTTPRYTYDSGENKSTTKNINVDNKTTNNNVKTNYPIEPKREASLLEITPTESNWNNFTFSLPTTQHKTKFLPIRVSVYSLPMVRAQYLDIPN